MKHRIPIPSRRSIRWTMLLFATVLIALSAANTVRIYQVERDRLMAEGEKDVREVAAQLDTALRRMKSVMDAVSVEVEDFLEQEKPSHAALEEFLRAKTMRLQATVDKSYTELYVARKGWYASGIGWSPPSTFLPENRPWFGRAFAHPGVSVLQPPYYALPRNELIVAVSRLLSDGRTVVSLDVGMSIFNPALVHRGGDVRRPSSYVFFLAPDGTVVAHAGKGPSGRTVVGRVEPDPGDDGPRLKAEDEGVVIFSEKVVDGWSAAVAVERAQLLSPVWFSMVWQLLASGALLLVGFCGLSYVVRRSQRATEAVSAANSVTMERALQALHARSSLVSYRAFLENLRERFDGDFCYMSNFDVKAQRSYIAKGCCIFRDGSGNSAQQELDLKLIEPQLADIAADGFCLVDGEAARRILGNRFEQLVPPCSRGFRFLVSIPLLVRGRLWGTLVIGFPRDGALDDAERDILFRCADVLSSAIERRDTYEEMMRKNEALRVALEAAEQGERAKTTFLATMSHEIRTPLNAVIGFAEFLRAPACTDAERREYTEGILTSSQALLSLINDILDLSKIEAGRMDIRGGACDFAKLFGEMRDVFRFRAAAKGIELRAELAPDFPVLALQEERVRQILLNLIGNAVKFTERGFVACSAAFAAGSLELRVEDTGPGISPERREAIFNPFVQDGGVRGGKVYEGTGLGLPICRSLVESVGGTVSVESELGKGSVFTVRIPDVAVSATRAAAPRPSESGRLDAALASAVRRRVFLVDDVPLNLHVAARHVQMQGVAKEDIFEFSSAVDALAALRTAAEAGDLPMAVLTDMWMPGMDGAALARAIRRDEVLRHLPIVALTADADVASSFDVTLFDAVLTKPLTRDKVREILEKLT